MSQPSPIPSYTVVVCGSTAVGKTSLIGRMSKDVFLDPDKCPVAGLMTPLLVDLKDKCVRLMLWDTSGDEDYLDMTLCHLADAQACIMVYSVDDPESFDAIFSVWIPALDTCSQVPHITVLVGAKMDLPESERVVDTEKAEMTFEIGPLFVSALDGTGIQEL
jgi:small GTP-binding protein